MVKTYYNIILAYKLHYRISLSNVTADVSVGLIIDDDAFSLINPSIDFVHDDVNVKVI